MIKALLRTDVPGFTNSSRSIFLWHLSLLNSFSRIFPHKKHVGTFLLGENTFTCGMLSSHSPLSIPPHPHWGELCSVTSSYGGSQILAELGTVFPTSQGEFNAGITVPMLRLRLSTLHTDPLTEKSLLHYPDTRVQPSEPSIRCLYVGRAYTIIKATAGHHCLDRPWATSSHLKANPTLSQELHKRPAWPLLPKMLDDYRSQVEDTRKCPLPCQHPKKTPSLVPQLLPWVWNPLAVQRN